MLFILGYFILILSSSMGFALRHSSFGQRAVYWFEIRGRVDLSGLKFVRSRDYLIAARDL